MKEMCSVQSEKPSKQNTLKVSAIVETRKFVGIAIRNRLPETKD